jgi:hypothetical protein
MERRAQQVIADGPLREVRMLRDFEPGERVAARLELSTGSALRRGAAAGVDVMGDGRIVAFAGGVRRRPLEPKGGQTPFHAVRHELAGE